MKEKPIDAKRIAEYLSSLSEKELDKLNDNINQISENLDKQLKKDTRRTNHGRTQKNNI